MLGEECAELANFVPEDRQVAVIDVEVVVLDVGEDRPSEREALVERPTVLLGEQRAILAGDLLAFEP